MTVRPSCDPFTAVRNLVDALDGIRGLGKWALDGIPTREQILNCLAGGTGSRSLDLMNTYDREDPIHLDAFKYRVGNLYNNVIFASGEASGQVSRLWRGRAKPLAVAGLYLTSLSADTFYGTCAARSKKMLQDCHRLKPVLAKVKNISEQMRVALEDGVPEDPSKVYRDARVMRDGVCRGLNDAANDFRKIANGVSTSLDLEQASCGALSLEQKLNAIGKALPSPPNPRRAKINELNRQLVMAVEAASRISQEIENGRQVIPAFDAQISQATYVPIAEEQLYNEIARQLDDVCERIQAYAGQGRYGEIYQAVPAIHETLAVSVEMLRNGHKGRVNQVRAHPCNEPFRGLAGELLSSPEVHDLLNDMEKFQEALRQSWTKGNQNILDQIDQLQGAVVSIEQVAERITDAVSGFQGAVKDLLDAACIDILGTILNESAFKELEQRFLHGLFGDIPQLIAESGDVAGRASQCLREFVSGANGTIPAGPGRQALDRITDAADTLSRVQEFAADASASVLGFRDSLTREIDDFAASIKLDAGAALGLKSPRVPNSDADFDTTAWRQEAELNPKYGWILKSHAAVTADGFVTAETDVGLPPGVTRDGDGYLRHDGVAPLPLGNVRDANGYLRNTAGIERTYNPSIAPTARAILQEDEVQEPRQVAIA